MSRSPVQIRPRAPREPAPLWGGFFSFRHKSRRADIRVRLHSMVSAPRTTPLGIPAYFGPWDLASWTALLRDRPVVAVINPDTGPGIRRHPGYVPLVRAMRRAGVRVLGYVPTGWLCRADTYLLSERHLRWYGVDGIFWDEIPVGPATIRELRSFTAWSSEHGLVAEAFNPGRRIPPSWRRVAPRAWWITFEGSGQDYLERDVVLGERGDWHLIHTVSGRNRRRVDKLVAERAPTLAYVTQDRLPNPWDCYPG
jgi:hypothetical protein